MSDCVYVTDTDRIDENVQCLVIQSSKILSTSIIFSLTEWSPAAHNICRGPEPPMDGAKSEINKCFLSSLPSSLDYRRVTLIMVLMSCFRNGSFIYFQKSEN